MPTGQPVGLWPLAAYFLQLGAFGFGGPALLGYIQRDLEAEKHWISRDDYRDGLAIAQTLPGPVVVQLVMWIGFIRHGVTGATVALLAFVLPAFLLTIALAAAYTRLGLTQIQALSYGIGPVIAGFIALSSWRLARATHGADLKLWIASLIVMIATASRAVDLPWVFLLAGLLGITVYAPPWRQKGAATATPSPSFLLPFSCPPLATFTLPLAVGGTLIALTLFFLKAAIFNFGGMAIVPFIHQGVVIDHEWLTEREFRDAVAIGLVSPGPTVIATCMFIGSLVAGVGGAALSAIALTVPLWALIVLGARLYLRHRTNEQLRAFGKGVTTAAVGSIAGVALLLGRGAIVDLPTTVIFLLASGTLYLRLVREPYLVGLAGLAGLLLAP